MRKIKQQASHEEIVVAQPLAGSPVQEPAQEQHEVVQKLQSIEGDVGNIKKQNTFSAFFQAGKNAKGLAGSIGDLTDVVKWELNMVLLVLNSQIKRKEEFDQIMESLNTVEQELKDDSEQKEYLNKVRSALNQMRERDDRMERLENKFSLFKKLAVTALCIAFAAVAVAVIAIILS